MADRDAEDAEAAAADLDTQLPMRAMACARTLKVALVVESKFVTPDSAATWSGVLRDEGMVVDDPAAVASALDGFGIRPGQGADDATIERLRLARRRGRRRRHRRATQSRRRSAA